MTLFLAQQNEADNVDTLKQIVFEFNGGELVHAVQVGGGRNSKCFRVTCEDRTQYFLKFYVHHPTAHFVRLKTEFSAFQFLWDQGLRGIPEPLEANESLGYGIYENIEGVQFTSDMITMPDVDALIQFLGDLSGFKGVLEKELFGPAAEAFFSIKEICYNVQDRRSRLEVAMEDHPDLKKFLEDHFKPFWDHILEWGQTMAEAYGLIWDEELPFTKRMLSPSDFGFHNALKRQNGSIVFVDFEYFGWDDPAKLISDFLLHPGVPADEHHKNHFAHSLVSQLQQDETLLARIKVVYPVFGLKWCLILLNEFLPVHMKRRRFAEKGEVKKDILEKQLSKAKMMLSTVQSRYQQLPYFE